MSECNRYCLKNVAKKKRDVFTMILVVYLLTNEQVVVGHNGEQLTKESNRDNVEILSFMASGKDFYSKYVRQAKPVVFRGGRERWAFDEMLKDDSIFMKGNEKETFSSAVESGVQANENNISLPLEQWLKNSRSKQKWIDLNISKSKILEYIYLPIMLQCGEYKIAHAKIKLSIADGVIDGPEKQYSDEMLYFSLQDDSKISLYDSLYSAEILKGRGTPENVKPTRIMLQKGDILYIPKFWWFQQQASGNQSFAIKMFFNVKLRRYNENYKKIYADQSDAIELHRKDLEIMPKYINCSSHTQKMREVLKINESDPKTLQLRIPKKILRPDDVTLASGYKMPVLGLGTALLNERTADIVKHALDLGYRLIDTAQGYPGSEAGIAKAMSESNVPRSEIFLVTKLHPRFLGYNSTLKAIDMSLKMLNTNYVDLFLIHSKECDDFLLKCKEGEPVGTWQESWAAMEKAHKDGKIRSLGVSNFNVPDLKALSKLATSPISVVQNWFDPIHQDAFVRRFCRKHGIRYMGYSTLGGMWTAMGIEENPILTSSLLTDLSTHYDYFVSSLVLRWAIHHNVTVIPRSTNRNHLAQNLRALDMNLSKLDIAEIDSMATILDDVLKELENEDIEEEQRAPGENKPVEVNDENNGENHSDKESDNSKISKTQGNEEKQTNLDETDDRESQKHSHINLNEINEESDQSNSNSKLEGGKHSTELK